MCSQSSCFHSAASTNMEENESRSQYDLNCTNLTVKHLINMNLSRGVTAAVCVLILTILLVALCLSKAYISVVQRLFLYLITATLACEVCLAATLEHQFQYRHQSKVCSALGFATHWSTTIVILCALGVIAYTILLVCISTKCNRLSSVTLSMKKRLILESLYLVLVIFLPLTVLWVPLMNGNYRLAYAWCGMSALNKETCEANGLIEIILAFGGYEVMSVAGIIAMFVLIIGYLRIGFYHTKDLLLQSIALTFSVLLYLLVVNSRFALLLHTTINNWNQSYSFTLYHGATIPLCQLIIPFGFLGSFYYKHFQNKCCKKINQYKRLKEHNKTFPASDRSTVPSSTFFNVPYTNGFTSVKRTDYEATQSLCAGTLDYKPCVSIV